MVNKQIWISRISYSTIYYQYTDSTMDEKMLIENYKEHLSAVIDQRYMLMSSRGICKHYKG